MASDGTWTPTKFPVIAPAPPNLVKTIPPLMAHSCRTCAARKVKCDKLSPTCSTCRKAKFDCIYQPLAARRRKRKLSGGESLAEKVARYENTLQQLGVLEAHGSTSSSSAPTLTPGEPVPEHGPMSLRFIPWGHSRTSKAGKLLASEGKSRYIDSDAWDDLDDDDDDDDHEEGNGCPVSEDGQAEDTLFIGGITLADPLTGAFAACTDQNLLRYHPAHHEAMLLWQVHVENVEPLCKILHIPSTKAMLESVSTRAETATKSDECLLFAIYHFAVFSMTDEECVEKIGQHRNPLRQRYHFATRQALVNASFLKTTDMSVLQSLVLFLLACRESYDPHTFWILTGVAVRIAQRMGIHRDGEKLGLPPFEVQMRRRLFYQLMPLDAVAGQISGAGVMMPPETWDTQPALNVNDDQIWPGMTESPQEQQCATDMIFCLSRFCIGKSIAGSGKKNHFALLSREFKDYSEAEKVITEAEREVEDKYIRYCDVVNPLHFLAAGLARCGITAMRLRIRLPKARALDATDKERREAMQLAQKILDTDSAVHDHVGLVKRFRWYVSAFFLWGTWDSLVFVLATLWKRSELFSRDEIQSAWDRVERVYRNHQELLDTKRALNVAFQRLTIKAWGASHPQGVVPDTTTPLFIETLRSLRRGGKAVVEVPCPSEEQEEGRDRIVLGNVEIDVPFEMAVADFNLESDDWTIWERLIESDHPTRTEDGFL